MWDRRAKVTSVHDGDTVIAVLDQGFRNQQEITVRLWNTYAPELKEPGGLETRDFIVQWVKKYGYATEWPFIVTTVRLKNDTKEVTTLERYVCVVTDVTGSHNLNADVQAFILDRGYGGGIGS